MSTAYCSAYGHVNTMSRSHEFILICVHTGGKTKEELNLAIVSTARCAYLNSLFHPFAFISWNERVRSEWMHLENELTCEGIGFFHSEFLNEVIVSLELWNESNLIFFILFNKIDFLLEGMGIGHRLSGKCNSRQIDPKREVKRTFFFPAWI